MAANDGQTFDQQSPQTQQDFASVFGGSAEQAWEQEHNAAIAGQSSTPTSPTTMTTTPAATTTTTTQNATTQQPNLTGLANFASQTSGVTQAQLAQQKAEFDAQLAFQREQMEKLGIPQMQINQYLANLQQQQFQAQLAQTQGSLTGYYTAPQFQPLTLSNPTGTGIGGGGGGTTATTGGGGTAAGGQDQYIQARTAQLQQVAGMSATQAQQTASSEWAQGLAQQGNVAYGMPSGYTTGGGAAGAPSANDAQARYLQARAAQLQQVANMPAAQAQQTAQAEWLQGYAQQGNVAYGMPQGFSMAAPTSTPAATGGTGGTPTVSGPTTGPGQPAGSQQTMALGQLLGMYNGMPTEAATEYARTLAENQRQYDLTLGLQRGQLGQQYLATAAQLQGPQNTFQLSNYLRGAQGNQAVPTYISALQRNIGLPTFQASGTQAPTTQTAGGLLGQMSGQQSATPGWDYNQTLGAMQNIANRGAQALGPGALERLTPDELQAFGSGLGAVGSSLPSFLNQYQQSRVGQAAGTGRTTLA